MKLVKLGLLVFAAVLGGACVVAPHPPTPYQPFGRLGGYTDFETEPGVHYVAFQAMPSTGRPIILKFWYRRVAEICGGIDRYEILSMDDASLIAEATGVRAGLKTYIDGGKTPLTTYPGIEGYVRCLGEEQ